MVRIGVTGNLCSGKTTICKMFNEIGIPIFNTDSMIKDIEGFSYIKQLYKENFGDAIFVNDILDRDKLMNLMSDKNNASKFIKIVKPYIKKEFEGFCLKHDKSPYIILESSFLYETNSHKDFDYIIGVITNDETKKIRCDTNFDGVQFPNEFIKTKCDFVVYNDNSYTTLKLTERVLEIHNFLCTETLKKIYQ